MIRLGPVRILVLMGLTALALGQQNGPLDGLANLSDAVSKRASSADRSGGNADWVEVKAKSTVTLADISGVGSIRHIWFTINSPSPFHLRELVLRMYWDGEADPALKFQSAISLEPDSSTRMFPEDIAGRNINRGGRCPSPCRIAL